MEWSPEHAMKAYLHAVQLCENNIVGNCDLGRTSLVEPKGIEFISALAAGKGSRLIVQFTSGGVTSLTISLAAAAKQRGGRLVCFLGENEDMEYCKGQLSRHGVDNVTQLVYRNHGEMLKNIKNIDFAVIDAKFSSISKLVKVMDVNPAGYCVVLNSVYSGRGRNLQFCDVVEGKNGVRVLTMPIGEGMELVKLESNKKCESGRYKRFYVTFES